MCKGCNKDKLIVNKKYELCGDCVFRKSHNGKSRQEVYSERAALKPKKAYKIKTYASPKQQTKKQAVRSNALSELKGSIELEAIQSDMYYCWGCGSSHVGLDKSHTLSVGQFKELELDKDNINLFCRDCHVKWEGGIVEQQVMLLTFEKDIEYIKEHSEEYFQRILSKMRNYLIFNTTSSAALKMKNILRKYPEKSC